jgi:hypothetical protein
MRSSPLVSNDLPAEDAAGLLGQLAEAGARLLRVERKVAPGPSGARCSITLSLLFDQGGLELTAPAGSLLGARQGPEPREGLLEANEEDPWWTLLGAPLARVDAQADGSLLLQFRADEDSPKILVLAAEGTAVSVRTLV